MAQQGKAATIILAITTVVGLGAAGVAFVLEEQERTKRAALEGELAVVTQAKNAAEAQMADLRRARAQAESELARIRSEGDRLTQQLAQVQEEKDALNQQLSDKSAEIDRLSQAVQEEQTNRSTLAEQLSRAQSDYQMAQSDLEELRKSKLTLEAKLKDLTGGRPVELERVVVKKSEMNFAGNAAEAIAPALEGQVLVVNREFDFIVVNLGKSQGVAIGKTMQVVRGQDVLGTVRVEKVYDTLSAAAILPESKKDQIKEGDTVRTL